MARTIYYQGIPGKKFGIWDHAEKSWKYEVCEDTPMLAMARLYQKIGACAKKSRYEARMLPDAIHGN